MESLLNKGKHTMSAWLIIAGLRSITLINQLSLQNLVKLIQQSCSQILAVSLKSNSGYGQIEKPFAELRMQIAGTDGDTERIALCLKLATNYLIKMHELAKI